MENVKIKEQTGFMAKRAIYICTLADGVSKKSIAYQREIKYRIQFGLPGVQELIDEFNKLFMSTRYRYENVIPNVALNGIMDNVGNSSGTPVSILATTFCVGTNAAAPAAGDTGLGTQTYSNTIASRTAAGTSFYLTGFIDATEDVNHYYEAGFKSSDILLSHVAIDVNKTNTKTLTVSVQGTISYV